VPRRHHESVIRDVTEIELFEIGPIDGIVPVLALDPPSDNIEASAFQKPFGNEITPFLRDLDLGDNECTKRDA
jgi:hypothetical protein